MIQYFIEEALSNRSQCVKCNKVIKKGSLRVKTWTGNSGGYNFYRYFCKKCGKNRLVEDVIDLKEYIKRLK